MGSRFVVLLAGITSSAWTRWASALKASKSRGITGTAIEVYGLLLAQEVSERLKREAALVDEGAFRNVQVTPIDQQMLAQETGLRWLVQVCRLIGLEPYMVWIL
jgi:hypothetical protein